MAVRPGHGNYLASGCFSCPGLPDPNMLNIIAAMVKSLKK